MLNDLLFQIDLRFCGGFVVDQEFLDVPPRLLLSQAHSIPIIYDYKLVRHFCRFCEWARVLAGWRLLDIQPLSERRGRGGQYLFVFAVGSALCLLVREIALVDAHFLIADSAGSFLQFGWTLHYYVRVALGMHQRAAMWAVLDLVLAVIGGRVHFF